MQHRPFKLLRPLAMTVALAAVAFSCRPASYELLKPSKGSQVVSSGPPSPFGPGGQPPAPKANGAGPTARVEVIWNGLSVTKVHVNQPTSIRPSWDTLDPDYIGIDACANPGIARADYGVGTEAKPSAARALGCESLAVPYTFTHTGDIEITLLATSRDNKTALATMILTVVDDTTPPAGDGGFTISATPMVGGKGQVVTFTGDCELVEQHTITWNFGDGGTATGTVVTHTYAADGQYKVVATCTGTSGTTLTATLTIVVVDNPPVMPNPPLDPTPTPTPVPTPTPTSTGTGTGTGTGTPGQLPTQQPGQLPNQQQTGCNGCTTTDPSYTPVYNPGSTFSTGW